jgi:hypothetical protein
MSESGHGARATAAVVVVGLLFIAGLLAEVRYLNGPSYWEWPWLDLSLTRAARFMGLPFLLLLWVLREIDRESGARRAWILVALLVCINFSLQVGALAAGPHALSRVKQIVLHPDATDYYRQALGIGSLRGWLAGFHQNDSLGVHSVNHPPGPILYFYSLVRLLGAARGARWGGYAIGLMGSFGVAVTYLFSGLWTSSVRARLLASAFYALLPALILFFPLFDQVYPICSMLMVFLWVRTLSETGMVRAVFAICLGCVLFGSTMLAYGLLTVGAFMAMYALVLLVTDDDAHTYRSRIIGSGLLSLAVCVALHLVLWRLTGYDAVQGFIHAWDHNNIVMATTYVAPYYTTLIFGPYDLLVGSGMLAVPMLALYGRRAVHDFNRDRSDVVLSFLGLATILIVTLTALLPSETARLELFLQPFLVVPVALELNRFPLSSRLVIFTVQWLVVTVMKCKLGFITL